MKEKTPNIIPFFVLTTTTLMFWTFFDIYRNFKKETPAVVPPEIIAPINPKLDVATLDELDQRFYIEDSLIEDTIYAPSGTPKSTLSAKPRTSPTPTASTSGRPTSTASASATP